ncbi:hypothetical protein AMTR_s00041p00176190 [Amborella trichopoda]|uniref:Uncharacterized protein n=1 Tax=Amborella trichopoda TaxID=13333 RepID=W1PYJ9_AMBTC|nr:hypothetical protein AMTR_s00041p00176190 [Amborella trichopoda]
MELNGTPETPDTSGGWEKCVARGAFCHAARGAYCYSARSDRGNETQCELRHPKPLWKTLYSVQGDTALCSSKTRKETRRPKSDVRPMVDRAPQDSSGPFCTYHYGCHQVAFRPDRPQKGQQL